MWVSVCVCVCVWTVEIENSRLAHIYTRHRVTKLHITGGAGLAWLLSRLPGAQQSVGGPRLTLFVLTLSARSKRLSSRTHSNKAYVTCKAREGGIKKYWGEENSGSIDPRELDSWQKTGRRKLWLSCNKCRGPYKAGPACCHIAAVLLLLVSPTLRAWMSVEYMHIQSRTCRPAGALLESLSLSFAPDWHGVWQMMFDRFPRRDIVDCHEVVALTHVTVHYSKNVSLPSCCAGQWSSAPTGPPPPPTTNSVVGVGIDIDRIE
jgi:hypothetical protein